MRIKFAPMGSNIDLVAKHEASSAGISLVQPSLAHTRKLAVIGGGPSVRKHLARLRAWSGEVWAMNGAVKYLLDRGIASTLVTVDPCELSERDFQMMLGANEALLSVACDPKLFDAYANRVLAFYITPNERAPFVADGGPSTATRIPMLAIKMGYRDVTYFGCEGSYGHQSHIYADLRLKDELWIKAGDKQYRTDPQLLMQCQYLADLISKFPNGFHEESGGLLRAMIKHPNTWGVARVSAALRQRLSTQHEAQL